MGCKQGIPESALGIMNFLCCNVALPCAVILSVAALESSPGMWRSLSSGIVIMLASTLAQGREGGIWPGSHIDRRETGTFGKMRRMKRMRKRMMVMFGMAVAVMTAGCSGQGQSAGQTTAAVQTETQAAGPAADRAAEQSENQTTETAESGQERETTSATAGEPESSKTETVLTGSTKGQGEKPMVYMTDSITPEGLMAVYDAMGRDMSGKVAVKLSMGEPGGHNYLSPDLIKDLVARVDGTIVDSNTAYGGQRASTALHLQVAEDHGFAAIAPIDILDSEGTMDLPVAEGKHLTKDIVGAGLADYDSMLVLSHFKGHAMGGFGGALKNISIGVASQNGKLLIHSGGASDSSWSGGTQDDFLESMAEAAKAVSDYMEGNMVYISVMNNLSVDCDCDSNPAQPDMHDIGILASTDPVALDQACVDLVYAAEDGASLIQRIESRNGILTVAHAQEIGLGTREYTLVSLDE